MKKTFCKKHNFPALSSFPENINTDVEVIEIYRNQIKTLEVSNIFPNLEKLDVSDNKIEELPEEICKNFPNLKIFDLSFNLLKRVPKFGSSTLKELYLHCNDISDSTTDCDKCGGGESGNIGRNEPLSFNYINLEKIDLACNCIHQIPLIESINMRELYLASNHIKHINYEYLQRLPKLETLSLESNLIESIDCNLLPKSITTLLLSQNPMLVKIENLESLINLELLDLSRTKIGELPPNLSENVEVWVEDLL